MPNLKGKGSTPNRGDAGAPKIPDNSVSRVVKTVEAEKGKEPGRADVVSEQGLPNFGVAGEDGAVDGNGEFIFCL